MSTNLHYEKNSMRKSHRITIPLKIHVQNKMYDVLDWSLTGVSISDKDTTSLKGQEFYDAVLMLGLSDASMSLRVKLRRVYHKDGKYGFEFTDLSSKNKKVLRRYLELYLDGKLEQVDDLMAVYEEPDINSAIQEPVKLNEQEKGNLEKSFLRKSLGAMLFSLLLLAGIATLLYQNFLYRYELAGTVAGNYTKIYTQSEGIIDTIHVKAGQKVKKDTLLADLNGDKILSQLKVLQSIKDARVKEKKLQASLKKNIPTIPINREVLSLKKQAVSEYYGMLQNARVQFQNRLITNQEFIDIKMKYQEAKEGYALYKSQNAYPQGGTIQALQKVVNVEEVDLQILEKRRLMEELRLFSLEDGIIYDVLAKSGDSVGKNDPLLTLWTYKVPQIICVLSTYKASDLKIGSKVEIVDSIDGQEFTGIVKEIKNTSYEQDSKTPRLKSFNDVFVVIEPEKNAIVLPPHSMVKVKFKRSFGF